MKLGGKILLFFSSYLPCWLILSVSQGLQINKISLTGIILVIISFFTYFLFKRTYRYMTLDNQAQIYVQKISSGSSEVVSYLLTLVIPTATSQTLFSIFEGNIDLNFLVLAILGITIFLIYVNSNLVVINPLLVIFGFSLFMIDYTISDGASTIVEGILITKDTFDPETVPREILVQKIDRSVYMLTT